MLRTIVYKLQYGKWNWLHVKSSAIEYSYLVPRSTDLEKENMCAIFPWILLQEWLQLCFPFLLLITHSQECDIVVKLKVKKADGTALAVDSAVALADNVIRTFLLAKHGQLHQKRLAFWGKFPVAFFDRALNVCHHYKISNWNLNYTIILLC